MDKAVLITGATGFLGREVLTAFSSQRWNAVGTGFTRAQSPILKLDLQSTAGVEAVLDEIKPQVVVHCAANKYPDKCTVDPAAAQALNVSATANLAKLCADRDILLLYISTDYVFPGTPGEAPYEVTDTPNPSNLYGLTKWDGEKAVLTEYELREKTGSGVVLRVPVLYGSTQDAKESSINSLVDTVWKAQEGKVKVDHYAMRFPTNTEDVARVCHDISVRYTEKSDSTLPKILQFSAKDRYTKYEICLLFAEILGLGTDGLEPNNEADPPGLKVQRPFNAQLSNRALEEVGVDTATVDFTGWWRKEMSIFRK